MNILLNLHGVLSSESGDPIASGVMLYYSLNANNRVAIITSKNKADAENWLHSHGIIGYDDLVTKEVGIEGDDLTQRQFKMARHGAPIELYVDADPKMCAWVFEQQRVPTVLFSHPSYARMEHRPDSPSKVRTWADIEASVDRVNKARSEDRMRPQHEIGEYSD